MGFLDAILGRTRPPQADIDVLFSVPQAALSLESHGYRFAGQGAVCFRVAEGGAFTSVETEVRHLLSTDEDVVVEQTDDAYGFRWLSVAALHEDVTGVVTALHAVNSSLTDAGFGSALLCSIVTFVASDERRIALVYLYKRGTFYPFVPAGTNTRDNALELQIRAIVADDVPVEAELSRWLAIWGAPGL